jgi:hypothetical protein
MGSCVDALGHARYPHADMSPVPGTNRIEHLAQAVAERVVTLVMDAIDVNAILARIDVNAIVQRVDLDAMLDKLDVEKVVERVDVEKLVEGVDVQKIIDRIDIDALVEHTELGTIIARSTSGVASEALDAVRAQAVGLDDFVARWTNRLLRRSPESLPLGPPLLVAPGRRTPALTAGDSGGKG